MKQNSKKGYTLLEVMMVVVIVGILAAVAVPNMSGWQARRELNSASRDIASMLQQARSEAVRRNMVVWVEFDSGSRTYLMRTNTLILVPAKTLPQGISFSAINNFASNRARFTNRGFAEAQGDVRIRVTARPDNDLWRRQISLTLGGSISITP